MSEMHEVVIRVPKTRPLGTNFDVLGDTLRRMDEAIKPLVEAHRRAMSALESFAAKSAFGALQETVRQTNKAFEPFLEKMQQNNERMAAAFSFPKLKLMDFRMPEVGYSWMRSQHRCCSCCKCGSCNS